MQNQQDKRVSGAWNGLAVVSSEIPSSSRERAPSESCAIVFSCPSAATPINNKLPCEAWAAATAALRSWLTAAGIADGPVFPVKGTQ